MLPETVAELAAGNRVGVANLYEFEFASGTKRFWNGVGNLVAGGDTWQGAGEVISVSGLETPTHQSAPQATFVLTGASDELIAYSATADEEVTGRPCRVFIQFFSAAYTPLDSPIAIWAGHMDVLSFRTGVEQQTITLTAESLFVNKNRAPFGFMTDTDQQARWPGDRGMEFMPQLVNKSVKWLRG